MTWLHSLLLPLLCIPPTSVRVSMIPLYLCNKTETAFAVMLPDINLQVVVRSHETIKLSDICFEDTNYTLFIKDLDADFIYESVALTPFNVRKATITLHYIDNQLNISIEGQPR